MPDKAGSELNARPEPGTLFSLIVLVSLPSMAAAIAGSEQAAIAPFGAASPAPAAPKVNVSDTRPVASEFLNMSSVPRDDRAEGVITGTIDRLTFRKVGTKP